MITDLSRAQIEDINFLLKSNGYNASVLVDERDDWFSDAAKFIYQSVRNEIDSVLNFMGIDANIRVCTILDDPSIFQACAVKFSTTEFCIAVWVGVPSRNKSASAHLISTNSFCEFVGIDPPMSWLWPTITGGDTFHAFHQIGMQLPRGSYTKLTKELLDEQQTSAFRWLILHEVAHIINGHTELGRVTNGVSFILERDPGRVLDDNLTSHALEMDADAFATMMTLQERMGCFSVLESHHGVALPDRRYDLAAISGSFAILTMIRGFDYNAFTAEEIFSSDHPPGGMRINQFLGLVGTLTLDNRFPYVTEEVALAICNCVVALEDAISEATGIPSRGGNIATAYEITFNDYNRRVLARWAKIYPTLNARKLNPRKLAPPQYDPE